VKKISRIFLILEWDKYVKKNTSFQNWDEMFSKAGEEYLSNQVKSEIDKATKGE